MDLTSATLQQVAEELGPDLLELARRYEGTEREYPMLFAVLSFAVFFMTRRFGIESTQHVLQSMITRLDNILEEEDGPTDDVTPPRTN